MADMPENTRLHGPVHPHSVDFSGAASPRKYLSLHMQTRHALADLLDALGYLPEKSHETLASLHREQWTEGVSTESGRRIEKWLDEFAGSMLAGTVKPTLHINKILSDWQRGLSGRLKELDHHRHSRFPHLESRSLCAKVSEAGTIARFLSAYPMVSHEDNMRMRSSIVRLGLSVDESYRLVARMVRRKDVCDENRDRLIDALMQPSGAANARMPAHIDDVFSTGGDLDAFLAYAAQHRDNPAWLPAAKLLKKRREPAPGNDMTHVVSAAILDARRTVAAHDVDSTIAPLKAIYRKIGNADIAHILQTALDACAAREDEWLFHLFSHVAGAGPQGGFKVRLREALKHLTKHDRTDETLRMALFRFAIHADLLKAAELLCREAGPEIDLDACLSEAIEQTRFMTVNPEAVQIIIAAMTPKQRGRALSEIRSHLHPRDIAEKENLLRKKDGELLLDKMFMHMNHPPFLPSKALAHYVAVLRNEISQDLERQKSRHANLEQLARMVETVIHSAGG
ncbi:MAG: hypothetical protein JWQ00_423 [Noviherbaspirillum sp.]|nr:hypothetical protein [Noviherbaspirillum sp.]